MEDYDKIKKTLAVAFMHDLDANRPEGKMCLSNGECADIEKAFNEQDWPKLARYLDKYTESEDEIHRKWILEYLYDGLRKADEQFKDHFKSAIEWLEKQKEPKHAPDDLQRSFEEGQKSIVGNPEKYGLCKKAEWSEEDERMRNQLIYDVEQHKEKCLISAKQNKATKAIYDGIEKCQDEKIAWLKCLRPSWKPSEEQMRALDEVVYGNKDLESLREQLKKL